MSEFDKVMSERSDFELFEIINYDYDKYKPEAVLAAKKAFEARHIDNDQRLEFERKHDAAVALKRQKEHRSKELKSKALDFGMLFLPTVKNSHSKTMLSLCIFLGLTFLFYLVRDFGLLIAFFSDIGSWDLSVYEFLLPYVLFPIGIFGLWKVKTYGWYIINGLLTYYAFATIFSGFSLYRFTVGRSDYLFDQIESIFPTPSLAAILVRFVVLFGIVMFLNKAKILEKFKIQKRSGLLFLALIIVITTGIWSQLL